VELMLTAVGFVIYAGKDRLYFLDPIIFTANLSLSFHLPKGKAVPLQALASPEGSRRSRLPDFKTVGT